MRRTKCQLKEKGIRNANAIVNIILVVGWYWRIIKHKTSFHCSTNFYLLNNKMWLKVLFFNFDYILAMLPPNMHFLCSILSERLVTVLKKWLNATSQMEKSMTFKNNKYTFPGQD